MKKNNLLIFEQLFSSKQNEIFNTFSFPNSPLKNVAIGKTLLDTDNSSDNRILSNFNLLEYIVDGEGTLQCGDKSYEIKKGMTIFIPHNVEYSFASSTKNPCRKIWITYSCNYLEHMVRGFNIKAGVFFVDNYVEFSGIINLSKIQDTNDIIFTIADKIHKILIKLATFPTLTKNDNIDDIKRQLDSIVYSKGNLDNIIASIGISKSTLIKSFRQTYGCTPYKYLLDKKLEIAKDYLVSTKISIKAIAILLSFTDEHYFSYLFKRKTKLSPNEYRKMNTQYQTTNPKN